MGKTSNLAVLSNTFDVNSSGAVSIGGSTGTSGQVLTSQGPGAPPQWAGVSGTTTQNIGTMTASSRVQLFISLTGAQLGDYVDASASINLQGVRLFGVVSSANTVLLCWENYTGGSVTLGSATYYIRCTRP